MADDRNKSVQRKAQDTKQYINGVATPDGDGDHMSPGRKRRISQKPVPHFDWRLLMSGNQLGFLAVVISVISALYTAGWIPGIAKQTDVADLSRQIVEIKTVITGLAHEFSDTRVEIVKAVATTARIEGRLENDAQIRARAARKVETEKPVQKAKGFFD